MDFVISPITSWSTAAARSPRSSLTEFGSGGKLGTSDLLMLGFVLFVFTLIVNILASMIVNRSRSGKGVEL